jgi:hypothetical protein
MLDPNCEEKTTRDSIKRHGYYQNAGPFSCESSTPLPWLLPQVLGLGADALAKNRQRTNNGLIVRPVEPLFDLHEA